MERTCPGCGNPIPMGMFACAADWRRLPVAHRNAIGRAWARRKAKQPGATKDHMAAKQAGAQWLAANPR